MTVILRNAVSALGPAARKAYDEGHLSDLVYADDTLLISSSSHHLDEYLSCVAQMGGAYGMQRHWQKFQLVSVNSEA